MKKGVQVILCIIVAVVVLVGMFAVWWYMGIDMEKRYKDLFDKTFDGNYTMTVKNSGTASIKDTGFIFPVKYKVYDVKYYDVDGNERHLELSDMIQSGGTVRSILSTALNRDKYYDLQVASALAIESGCIFTDQMEEKLPEFYDDDLKFDSSLISGAVKRFNGDGTRFQLVSFEYGSLYATRDFCDDIIFSDELRDYLDESLSPETCNVLSKQDMKSFVNSKTAYFNVIITLSDKQKFEKAEEYNDITESYVSSLAKLSDFGGNYMYRVFTDEDPDDDNKGDLAFEKSVVLGEETELVNDSYSKTLMNALKQ